MKIAETWKIGLFIAILVTFLVAVVYGYLQLFGFLAIAALKTPEMLQSVIQAEATILGFLGVIAAYTLSSYDTRIDRLNQQYFDLEHPLLDKLETSSETRMNLIRQRIERTKEMKKSALLIIGVSSILLILSLLLLTTTLGIRNEVAGGVGFYVFFGSISNIGFLFYQMSKDTDEMLE